MMFKEIKKTFSINILNFNFVPNEEQFHNCYKIINTKTRKDDKLHDIFELHYLELIVRSNLTEVRQIQLNC